jgi:hypothetical protein
MGFFSELLHSSESHEEHVPSAPMSVEEATVRRDEIIAQLGPIEEKILKNQVLTHDEEKLREELNPELVDLNELLEQEH